MLIRLTKYWRKALDENLGNTVNLMELSKEFDCFLTTSQPPYSQIKVKLTAKGSIW